MPTKTFHYVPTVQRLFFLKTLFLFDKNLFFLHFLFLTGDLSENEKNQVRKDWYSKLAKSVKQKKLYPHYLSNPPPPIDDLRKTEDLRVPYVQKKIRKRVKEQDSKIENKNENENENQN